MYQKFCHTAHKKLPSKNRTAVHTLKIIICYPTLDDCCRTFPTPIGTYKQAQWLFLNKFLFIIFGFWLTVITFTEITVTCT
jgi:hypothetical protein